MNILVAMAENDSGRTYITPEDVSEALKAYPVDAVRLAVLEVIGKQAGAGAEDASLCAYIAFRGTPTIDQ